MQKTAILLSSLLLLSACHKDDQHDEQPIAASVESLETQVENYNLNAEIQLSVGSGLHVASYDAITGEAILYGLTDRGPNGDSPAPLHATTSINATKVFPIPDFQPALFRMSYRPGHGLKILDRIGLNDQGKAISGLPIPIGGIGSSGEQALSELLQPLAFDPKGMDPEGIAFDRDGKAWICDEYGPFLAQVDVKTGAILQKLAPGQGLPEILAQRQANRGFEGVAVNEEGKVYAIVQSTLDVAGKTKKIADFVRLVEFDPATSKTRMFAYPIDAKAYSKTSDAKIGDLLSLGQGRFAVIEQGTGLDKAMHNVIYGIDLKNATDLTGLKISSGTQAGKDLEYARLEELATSGVQSVRKVLLADLRSLGWTQEKAEGLARLDGRTLLIASDNDFGLKATIENGASTSLDDYRVDEKGVLYQDGVPAAGQYKLTRGEVPTQMMILKLDSAFDQF